MKVLTAQYRLRRNYVRSTIMEETLSGVTAKLGGGDNVDRFYYGNKDTRVKRKDTK